MAVELPNERRTVRPHTPPRRCTDAPRHHQIPRRGAATPAPRHCQRRSVGPRAPRRHAVVRRRRGHSPSPTRCRPPRRWHLDGPGPYSFARRPRRPARGSRALGWRCPVGRRRLLAAQRRTAAGLVRRPLASRPGVRSPHPRWVASGSRVNGWREDGSCLDVTVRGDG